MDVMLQYHCFFRFLAFLLCFSSILSAYATFNPVSCQQDGQNGQDIKISRWPGIVGLRTNRAISEREKREKTQSAYRILNRIDYILSSHKPKDISVVFTPRRPLQAWRQRREMKRDVNSRHQGLERRILGIGV